MHRFSTQDEGIIANNTRMAPNRVSVIARGVAVLCLQGLRSTYAVQVVQAAVMQRAGCAVGGKSA
ncbi:hypothetical protein [Thioalkalivibrio sp. ALJT]|uniref:hypothetical protein n=1 Tax=Thioalkalivibrio sp. ALJT TaxID=1158146 RepID=UPI00039EE370|nr:hypothetical protein [Thioalkalivibrio sp. ALJT]